MKPSSRRLGWLAALALAAAATVGIYVAHLRPKLAATRYQAHLRAAGEELAVDGLQPAFIPGKQDGTARFERAIQQMFSGAVTAAETNRPEALGLVAPGKAIAGWAQAEIIDRAARPWVTNTWSDLESALAPRRAGLAALRGLSERPAVNLHLDYAQGFSLPLPHLAPAKASAQRLSVAAQCALRRGDTAAALADVRAMVALAHALRDERLVISQLIRMAMAQMAFAATWSLLQAPGVTDEQLAGLQPAWSELEFARATENAVAMERAMCEMTVAQMRESSAEFRNVVLGTGAAGGGGATAALPGGLARAAQLTAKETIWRHRWSYTDELGALRGYQAVLVALRQARTNGCFQPAIRELQTKLAELGIVSRSDHFGSYHPWDRSLRNAFTQTIAWLPSAVDRAQQAEAARRLALAGLALRRYHLRHGRPPPSLAALVPAFLETVPRDPVDGEPLRYRTVETNSFLLYSIGADAKDDGGNPEPSAPKEDFAWFRGRDWVWPQPATEAEVRAAYDPAARPNRR